VRRSAFSNTTPAAGTSHRRVLCRASEVSVVFARSASPSSTAAGSSSSRAPPA
jgi:chorismate-pyruvate lyase